MQAPGHQLSPFPIPARERDHFAGAIRTKIIREVVDGPTSVLYWAKHRNAAPFKRNDQLLGARRGIGSVTTGNGRSAEGRRGAPPR